MPIFKFVLEDADGVEAGWVSVVLPIIVEESNCLDHISYRQRAVFVKLLGDVFMGICVQLAKLVPMTGKKPQK